MRIGLQVPSFTWPGGTAEIGARLAEIGRTADDAGFYSLWVMDHFFQIGMVGPPEHAMLEGYSALSFLAGVTKHVKLGTLVTGVHYRHPGILVKTATTLDVLSGGRAYLGIGAGWNEQESRGLGVPFPPLKDRFERLEEALQIAHQMWKGDRSAYSGAHYQLADPLNSPQPLAQPHPPNTPMPAICSHAWAAMCCARSWMCCVGTAKRWAGRMRRSSARHSTPPTSRPVAQARPT